MGIKIQQINRDIFQNQILLDSIDICFILFKPSSNSKRYKAKKYYLPKVIIDNYSVITNGKNFYDQAIDSNIKRYKQSKELTAGPGEDYTTECLLYQDYVKSHYRLIAVNHKLMINLCLP